MVNIKTLQDFQPYLNSQGKITKASTQVLQDWFIFRSAQIFGTLYEYDQVKYTGSRNQVLLFCTQCCSYFQVTPDAHINKHNGCPCQHVKGRWSAERFILEALEKFGDTYDYTNVSFKNILDKVLIGCREHGLFEKVARDHVDGTLLHGCPRCSVKSQSTYVYLLVCNNTNLYKIGISNNPMIRKSQIGGNTTLRNEWYIGPEQPQVEKQLHNRYAQLRRINTAVRNGFTEFFQLKPEDIQDLVSYMDAQHWRRNG